MRKWNFRRRSVKLEGPATVEGDALTVSVYNRTDWHVSQVDVALTIVKKSGVRVASIPVNGIVGLVPAIAAYPSQEEEVRPEKRQDVTTIYRMRAAAPPSTTSVFSARLGRDLAADEEWHWAIVQARGYPPQSYAHSSSATAGQSDGPKLIESASDQPSASSPGVAPPQTSPAAFTPQNPQ